MQVTDARGMSAVEIAALMQKKAFDECELSPGVCTKFFFSNSKLMVIFQSVVE